MSDRRRLPTPPDRPRFDVDPEDDIFEDDALDDAPDGGGRPPRRPRAYDGGGHEDAGLFRMLGVLVLVATVVVALVLPASPLRVVGRGSGAGSDAAGQGISARARGDLPPLPPGLSAVSRLYELSVPDGLMGSQVIEVTLNGRADDGKNLGFYTYQDNVWKRLAVATLTADGKGASGELPYPPKSVAVLRSVVSARSLGLVVEGGQTPDARLLTGAAIVAVRGAALGTDAKTLSVRAGALEATSKVAGGKPVYLAVGAEADSGATAGQLGAVLAASIAGAAKAQGAGGVLVDLGAVPREQRDAVSRFAAELSARLRAERLGFLIAVPAAGRDGGAYDWNALLAVADGIWLIPRVDPSAYHAEVDAALTGAREAGVDTARVALVLDMRSQETWPGRRVALTRRNALALASTITRQSDSGVGGSATVNLYAPFLTGTGGGLRWDDGAKAVSFAFTEVGARHTVWIENRFSAAFRLDLAGRHGLGGIVVDQAEAGEGTAEITEMAAAFVQGAPPRLERPFGPYLVPCWQALSGGTIEGASACWQQDLAAPSAVWRTPHDAGSYAVRLVVSDGITFIGQELTLRVTPSGRAEPAGPSSAATATATAAAPATATRTATPAATATAPPSGTPRPPGPAGN